MSAPAGERLPAESAAPAAVIAPAETTSTEPGQRAEAQPMPTTPIGSLAFPHSLRHLYESLAHLEDGSAKGNVRVLQYGDSHTASDLGTAEVRRLLQSRFGEGGRGFVAFGQPWKHYVQDGVSTGMSHEFLPEKGKAQHGHFVGNRAYGLLGVAVASADRGGRAWIHAHVPSSHIEVSYYQQPTGGAFDLLVDHAKVARIDTKSAKAEAGFRAVDVPEGAHRVEVEVEGGGEVRLFGATFDRSTLGVEVDSLGINGAQIYTALGWSEAHMAEQWKHRAPDLVVLAYGTNESLNDTPSADYERKLVDLLGRVARAVPEASCLLLGPPDRATHTAHQDDWHTASKLVEIVASQRRVAEAAGCAFYNQLEAMGGAGTIAAWAKESPPRAIRDRIHLTKAGYVALAGTLVKDLTQAYRVWRESQGLAPDGTPSAAAGDRDPAPSARHGAPHRPRGRRTQGAKRSRGARDAQ